MWFADFIMAYKEEGIAYFESLQSSFFSDVIASIILIEIGIFIWFINYLRHYYKRIYHVKGL